MRCMRVCRTQYTSSTRDTTGTRTCRGQESKAREHIWHDTREAQGM